MINYPLFQYLVKISRSYARVIIYRSAVGLAMRSKLIFLVINKVDKWDEV